MQNQLLNWFENNKRDLPFRKNKNPYNIWISEIMLQQTQVDTVIPYYNRFMEKYPTLDDLAKATEEDVFKLWEGLGYYSRAKNILKCAKQIKEEHGGKFPIEYKEVLSLSGIGPYTAGAVLSISYDMKYPAVDGNVMRVMARVYNIEADISDAKTRKIFETKVSDIIPDEAGDFNQALMELGALICKPKNPNCMACPINKECYGKNHDKISQLPVKTKKVKNRKIEVAVGLIKKENKVLMVKNQKGLLAGLWGLVNGQGTTVQDSKNALMEEVLKNHQLTILRVESLGETKHVFTHRTWHMNVYEIMVSETNSINSNQRQWINQNDIDKYAISTANKKALAFLKGD